MNFLNTLMKTIIENRHMPKVQVERELGPILDIFIEAAFNQLAKNNSEIVEPGSYKLIASEFPLQTSNDNNRSFNIDYLMLNKGSNTLYFIELKTDVSSFKVEQYEKYKERVDRINGDAPLNAVNELFNFVGVLSRESSSKSKYEKYLEAIADKNLEEEFSLINKAKLVYLAPKFLFEENLSRGDVSRNALQELSKVTFEDLYNNNQIEHDYSEEWKLITGYLRELDFKPNYNIK